MTVYLWLVDGNSWIFELLKGPKTESINFPVFSDFRSSSKYSCYFT